MKPLPTNPKEVMQRWPRLVSHLICKSLGYFCPTGAALAILNHHQQKPNFCEWYSEWASKWKKRSNLDKPFEDVLLDVGRDALRMAFSQRHHHTGAMAEYEQARELVAEAVQTGQEPVFASWF